MEDFTWRRFVHAEPGRENTAIFLDDDGNELLQAGGTAASRYNNPENLKYGSPSGARAAGAIGMGRDRLGIFPDSQAGLDAMRKVVTQLGRSDWTIGKLVEQRYAPAKGGNDPARYKRQLTAWTGLPMTTKISELTTKPDGQYRLNTLLLAMQRAEGYLNELYEEKQPARMIDDLATIRGAHRIDYATE